MTLTGTALTVLGSSHYWALNTWRSAEHILGEV